MATRLDRLVAECGDELPLGADHGMASVTPADVARALLASDDPPRGDDADYCRAVLDGTADPGDPA